MRDRGKSQLGFLEKTSLCFSRTISFRETYLALSLLSFLLSLSFPLSHPNLGTENQPLAATVKTVFIARRGTWYLL